LASVVPAAEGGDRTSGDDVRASLIANPQPSSVAATMNAGTELCHKEDADQLYAIISKK
jgi:hypothetical protein